MADSRGAAPRRPVVLTLVDFYPPAFRAGGPMRSLPRIAAQLQDSIDFRVVTRDGDLGTSTPLPVRSDAWVACGPARCLYLSSRARARGRLVCVLRRLDHDALYINSVFSAEFSLLPLVLRRLGLIRRRGLLIAPRGELDPAALALKGRRKRLYVALGGRLGLFADATWHAANTAEAAAIKRAFGDGARVRIAADLPATPGTPVPLPAKGPGALAVAFIGRISPMKNLDFAIDVLHTVKSRVSFDVFGPIEDEAYWASCLRRAESLPSNVRMAYRGVLEPDAVAGAIAEHHVVFLPSRAESFGHVLVEALAAGRPIVTSDHTPWRDLEAEHAGFAIALHSPGPFAEVIDRFAGMSRRELQTWSTGARALAQRIAADPARDAAYRDLFEAVLHSGAR